MKNRKGFTITELVIVIAVIAILAAVLIPTFSTVIEKANKSAVLQEARNKYTEAHANDMSDGLLNGKEGDTDIADTNYAVSGTPAVATYELVDSERGYTATFDGTDWSVAAN